MSLCPSANCQKGEGFRCETGTMKVSPRGGGRSRQLTHTAVRRWEPSKSKQSQLVEGVVKGGPCLVKAKGQMEKPKWPQCRATIYACARHKGVQFASMTGSWNHALEPCTLARVGLAWRRRHVPKRDNSLLSVSPEKTCSIGEPFSQMQKGIYVQSGVWIH